MADRRVRYILEVDYDGEGVTALKAADDLREVDEAAREAREGLAAGGEGLFEVAGVDRDDAGAGLGIAGEGLEAVQQGGAGGV
jgi:hypothetical protein